MVCSFGLLLRSCLWFLLLRYCNSQDDKAAADYSGGGRQVLVKEVVLDSAVVDIAYLGKNHEAVILTTKSKRLYYSADAGENWAEITEKIDQGDVKVDRFIISPTDKQVAVLQVTRESTTDKKRYSYIYVTENGGKNWRKAWGKRNLHSLVFHPSKSRWALVSWWSGNCDSSTKKVDEKDDSPEAKLPCIHKLMVTKDLGRTFTEVTSYVVQFSWGSKTQKQDNRIYFTHYRVKSGDQGRLNLWTKAVDFSFVDLTNTGKPSGSITDSMNHGNKFLVSNEFILLAQVKDESAQTVRLMVSADGAKTWRASLLPSGMGELEEKWYTVLDTSEGAVIIHINSDQEGGNNVGMGRVFISDADGYRFTQSLNNNLRSAQGECEFDKVVSLEGVYMANMVVPEDPSKTGFAENQAKAQEEAEKEAAGGSAVDQRHGKNSGKKPSKQEKIVRTVISFDKGGAWSYLRPPKVDSQGKAFDCAGKPAEECSLHLHGATSWDYYAPFYSIESSVGIVMGTGNVGRTLRFEPDQTNTYLSRDGGLTWMEAHKGAFIYEFGDHGGLIVMADDLKKTVQVVFSWNEGQSWYDFDVSKVAFEVDNIITEPNVTATTFLMFGTRQEGEGVLYHMRYDALKFPTCRGVWAADSVSSDYETWSPSDGSSNTEKCLLGRQVTYTRRKRTSQCWNGEKFERPVEKKKCACTQEDYACEIGFVRQIGSVECTFGGDDMMPPSFSPTVCSGTWNADAYRKVPGDSCEGGFTPQKAAVPCPSNSSGYYRWVMIFLVVGGIGYFMCKPGAKPVPSFSTEAAKGGLVAGLAVGVGGVVEGIKSIPSMVSGPSRGFDSFSAVGYKKLDNKPEYDLDGIGGNDVMLSDFIDEAEHDDYAPRFNEKEPPPLLEPAPEASFTVKGGAHAATEAVPRLMAPPIGGGAPPATQIFDLANKDDEEDLL